MKKLIGTLLLSLNITILFGQIPVTDVAANTTLGLIQSMLIQLNTTSTKEEASVYTHLKEAYKQTTEMKEGNSKLEQMNETFKKVRTSIKEVNLVRKNLEYYFGSLQAYANIINNLRKNEHVSKEKLAKFDNKMSEMLDSMKDFRDLTTDLIKDDYFEMDDGKRLQLLMDSSDKLKLNYEKFSRLDNHLSKRSSTPIKD